MTKKAEERTLWETQGRSFVRDLDYGKKGEERIARHLRKYKSVVNVRDISNTRRGIDDLKSFMQMAMCPLLKSKPILWHTGREIWLMRNSHTETRAALQEQRQTISFTC